MSDDAPLVPSRRREPAAGSALPLLTAVLLGLLLGTVIMTWRNSAPRFAADPNDAAVDPRPAAAAVPPDADEAEAIALFKSARDSVVNVDTVLRVRNRLDMRVQEQQAGTGSGFFWDDQGRVVTNFHVVRQAVANQLTIRVVTADRTPLDARVVGLAPDFDLAVLQVPVDKGRPAKPLAVGTSADLQVGQKAFAIGNPFGLSLTMTQGIVSAVDREIESPGDKPITGAVQTDAPINPGNSGGPLLDKAGRLIGVNTSIASPSGGNVGIGFAIPVDTVNQVVTELIRRGRLLRPDLGVKLVDQRRVRRAGYPVGVMVESVDPGGPAAAAGVRGLAVDPGTGEVVPGDLIVGLDGRPVRSTQDFARLLSGLAIGGTAKLVVQRDDERLEVEVTVRGV